MQTLRYVGAALAVLVASLHLFHPDLGFPRLVRYIETGTLWDPRPALFTASGILIVAGILLVYNELARRSVYLLGIVLMAAYILGYGAWHTVLEHGGFWPHIEAHGHSDSGPIEVIITHLWDDHVALVSKLSELALLVVLVVLYWNDA